MVMKRGSKSFAMRQKIQNFLRQQELLKYLIRIWHFRTQFAEIFRMPNLHELWTQPAHVRCPVAELLFQLKSGSPPRLRRGTQKKRKICNKKLCIYL